MAAMVHLLLFLLAYKLYNARSHRDLLDIFLLTFLMLVSSALLTTSFGFLLVFCLYMILGVWGSILFHLRREADLAMPDRSGEVLAAPGLVTPGFMWSSLGVAAASLILTLVIFFLIPRLGRTFLPLRGRVRRPQHRLHRSGGARHLRRHPDRSHHRDAGELPGGSRGAGAPSQAALAGCSLRPL